jgi:hypothetical protein
MIEIIFYTGGDQTQAERIDVVLRHFTGKGNTEYL